MRTLRHQQGAVRGAPTIRDDLGQPARLSARSPVPSPHPAGTRGEGEAETEAAAWLMLSYRVEYTPVLFCPVVILDRVVKDITVTVSLHDVNCDVSAGIIAA